MMPARRVVRHTGAGPQGSQAQSTVENTVAAGSCARPMAALRTLVPVGGEDLPPTRRRKNDRLGAVAQVQQGLKATRWTGC